MTTTDILVFRQGDDWCVRSPGALFEKMPSQGAALRVARAHASAANRAGGGVEVQVRIGRRPR